jgi:cellulose biosynthesis protein BcsQ
MNQPSLTKPLVISFVSGKGGVGKTMLAVACARELSLNNRTLIIDLDFFNRGLTGLLGKGSRQCGEIEKPGFLLGTQEAQVEKWNIVEVSKNLFHIYYPDLSQEDMQKFETLNIEVLKESLHKFITEAARKCDCSCVVVDCHGGPDNSSFAACLVADYSLLISEPDRITFYGTLNFLRQLRKAGATGDFDLRLVFNKVVPAFSGLFLTGFYDRMIKAEFGGRPLLGIFPLEVYLTKEFEKTPFLTSVYPYSWLTKKTRLLLYDLLSATHRGVLAPVIRSMPRWMRAYRRISLGKTLPLLNISVIMPTIVTVGVVLVLFTISVDVFFNRERERIRKDIRAVEVLQCISKAPKLAADQDRVSRYLDNIYFNDESYNGPNNYEDLAPFHECMRRAEGSSSYDYMDLMSEIPMLTQNADSSSVPEQYRPQFAAALQELKNPPRLFVRAQRVLEIIGPYFGFLAYLGALWLVLALLFSWTNELDKRFTYYFRLHRYPMMVFFACTAPALWFAPLLIIAALVSLVREWLLGQIGPRFHGSHLQAFILITLGSIMFIMVISSQLYRIYRDARYERHYLEDLFRFLFLIYLVLAPYLLYRTFMR